MIPYHKLQNMPFGGDYNPEQWPEEIWEEDMRLLKKAHVNILTLNVFSWAALQPSEDTYDFSRLDRIVALAEQNGMMICMATSTAAHPAWMAKRYPDITRTDFEGRKHKFGIRHNSCPNSPTYRHYAPLLAEKLAARYKDHDSIIAWHISNEYGGECFCENCENAFRGWLKKRYSHLSALNEAWNTAFWGHTFYDWDEIVLPNMLTEYFDENSATLQGCSLDYRRFMSDSILECYDLEQDAIRKHIPDASCTTNMMGFYKPLDYKKWAKHLDFVSWDNYPTNDMDYAAIAMAHDLMRGIHDQDPFFLMEQTPSVSNWLPYNALKRPGVMRLWSWQAVAHGADSVMFFQMRRTRGGCEKMHGALIDHVGTDETRVFREAQALGAEIEAVGKRILNTRTMSRTAIVVDWENWWAVEYCAGPSRELQYRKELERVYAPLRHAGIDVDLITLDDDLSAYHTVIMPLLYMIRTGQDEKVRSFVKNGGILVTGFFSGIVDESDLVTLGGYPGNLKDILGIWVEEQDALPAESANSFSYHGKSYPAMILCDLLHLRGAQQMDDNGYEQDFYAGMPVLTRNQFGAGEAWYMATASSEEFYREFLVPICIGAHQSTEQAEDGIGSGRSIDEAGGDISRTIDEAGTDIGGTIDKADIDISVTGCKADPGIEISTRENNQERIWFFLNHQDTEGQLQLPFDGENLLTMQSVSAGMYKIKAKDLLIIAQKKN